MDKIVIQYCYGSEHSGGESVHCIEYPSIEGFYVDFENKVRAFIKAHENYREQWNKWNVGFKRGAVLLNQLRNRTPSPKRDKELAAAQAEFNENEKLRPHYPLPEQSFTIANVEFNAEDHVTSNSTGLAKNYEINMPIIMKLDEWFVAKVKDEI